MNKFNKLIKSINSRFGKFNNNELESVLNVLNNNKRLDYVKKLEDFQKFKVKYSIACNSGTSGLHSALAALDLKKVMKL